MSDDFKPLKRYPGYVGGPLLPEYAVQAPLLLPESAPSPTPHDRAREVRRRRRLANPSETSIAQEGLEAAEMLGLPIESEDVLLDLESSGLPIPGLTTRYNPNALGAGYVDALTFGNAPEIMALADTLGGDDYDAAHSARELQVGREYAASPGSAITGAIGGMANQLAIPMTGAAGGGNRFMQAVNRAAPLALAGAGAGAVSGAISADPGHRGEQAAYGGLRGLGLGGFAGALGQSAQALRAAEMTPLMRGLSILPRGALGGAEYGALAAPGTGPMTPEHIAHSVGTGAAYGTALEPLAAGAGGIARLLARRNARRLPPPGMEAPDESALLMSEDDLADVARVEESAREPLVADDALIPEAPRPVRSAREIVDEARAQHGNSPVSDLLEATVAADPAHQRFFSVAATGPGMRNAQNQGIASFGSMRNLVDELQRIGLAEEFTTYARDAERARALAAQQGILGELADTNRRIEAFGATRNPEDIAAAIEADADAFLALAPESEQRIQANRAMRDYAQRMRGVQETERLWNMETGAAEDLPVEMLNPPIGFGPLRSRMSAEWNAGQGSRSSPMVEAVQTPAQRVAPMLYRAMRPFRESMAAEALPAADYAIHIGNQRASLALNATNPLGQRLDIHANAQPADLRGALGRMQAMASSASQGGGVGDQAVSGMAGWLREQILANYIHSMRATANELRLASPMASAASDVARAAGSPIAGHATTATTLVPQSILMRGYTPQPLNEMGSAQDLQDEYDAAQRAGSPQSGSDMNDIDSAQDLEDEYDEYQRSLRSQGAP